MNNDSVLTKSLSDPILSQDKTDGFRIGDLLSFKGMNKKTRCDYDYVTIFFICAKNE